MNSPLPILSIVLQQQTGHPDPPRPVMTDSMFLEQLGQGRLFAEQAPQEGQR
jgi:hypothetical protein